MANATLFPVVAAALIDTQGRVLLQQRPAGKSLAGLWEFPGGKLEPGESPEAALVRELVEELGIRVAVADLTPATFASVPLGTRALVLLLYVVRTWTGTPAALEADMLAWVRPGDMPALPMPPADRPFIRHLERLLAEGSPG